MMVDPRFGLWSRLIERVRSIRTRRALRYVIRWLMPHDPGVPLIRLGSAHDGGYLVPDDLDGVQRCYSPGVGTQAAFELSLLDRGIPSTLIDGTVSEAPDERLDFMPVNLAPASGPGRTSMGDWFARFDERGDLILQMDIEGAELQVIPSIPRRDLARFRIIVIELHLFGLHQAAVRGALLRTIRHLGRDFVVVHLHPNNCCPVREVLEIPFPRVIEVTLLRRDRFCVPPTRRTPLPHPLDRPNNPNGPDLSVPEAWEAVWDRVRRPTMRWRQTSIADSGRRTRHRV